MDRPRKDTSSGQFVPMLSDAAPAGLPLWHALIAAVLIIAAGMIAYGNSYKCVWALDDFDSIMHNDNVRALTVHRELPLSEKLSDAFGSVHNTTISGRPIVSFTLALNFAFAEYYAEKEGLVVSKGDLPSGYDIWSYHVVNLAVHLLAALLLFGIIRRTLVTAPLRARFGSAAAWIAGISAIIWTVHPLQSESVTYVVQRVESVMAVFFLATIYCFIRAAQTPVDWRRIAWLVAAVAASALGMGSKEVMAVCPVVLLGYDLIFLRQARKFDLVDWIVAASGGVAVVLWVLLRKIVVGETPVAMDKFGTVIWLAIGVAAAVVVIDVVFVWLRHMHQNKKVSAAALAYQMLLLSELVFLVLWSIGPRADTAGFGKKLSDLISPTNYALTQPEVIGQYLMLTFWPKGLCLDYAWIMARLPDFYFSEHIPALAMAALMGFLLAAAPLLAWRRYREVLWMPAACLGGWALLVLIPAVLFNWPWGTRIPDDVLAYTSAQTLGVRIVPWAALVFFLLGATILGLIHQRWRAGAYLGLWFFIILGPTSSIVPLADLIFEHRMYLPLAAIIVGIVAGVYAVGREVLKRLEFLPDDRQSLSYAVSGIALVIALGITSALTAGTLDRNTVYDVDSNIYADTAKKRPYNARAHSNLGYCRANESATATNAAYSLEATGNIEEAKAQRVIAKAKLDEAIWLLKHATELDPNFHDAYHNLAVILTQNGRLNEAVELYKKVIGLYPRHYRAHNALAAVYMQMGQLDEAEREYQASLAINPPYADANTNYAVLMVQRGRRNEALELYTRAIQSESTAVEALIGRGNLHFSMGHFAESAADYQRAYAIAPTNQRALHSLAMLRAACPADEIRNGSEAVKIATQLVQMVPRDPQALAALAAAYAETGRFDEAVATQKKCLEIVAAQPEAVAFVEARLALYSSHRPLRTHPPTTQPPGTAPAEAAPVVQPPVSVH